jgi:Membrane protein involved in the export of O-antigen and teichoic acid
MQKKSIREWKRTSVGEKSGIRLDWIKKNGNAGRNVSGYAGGHAGKYFWNTTGSVCSAGTSFLLLIFVTRICGSSLAGIFALGFANAQLMLTIGRFGMRAYQATDVQSSVRFSTYLSSRFITCLFMLAVGFAYIWFSGYSLLKGAIVFSICFIKISDALEDVFHGLFQQQGRMDISGKLLTLRNGITIVVFILALALSRDLLLTCIITAVVSFFACILLNTAAAGKFTRLKLEFHKQELTSLFLNCAPLFIGTFLSLYIYNIPKYMIDRYLTLEMQTYYNILFMPTFVINLLSELLFKPILTDIALKWDQNRKAEFNRYIGKLFAGVTLTSLVVVTAGSLVGCGLLSFIYGVDLNSYQKELFLLLCSGGFSACVYLLFHILTAMRKQGVLFLGYAVTAVAVTLLTPGLVRHYGMMGAVFSCLISSLLLFAVFAGMLLFSVNKRQSVYEENSI